MQSRYYDPVVSRFINADRYASTDSGLISHNMFAYCENDPVNREDSSGEIWNFVVGGLTGVAATYVGDVISNVLSGETGWDILKPTSSLGSYAGAFVAGMIPGTGLARSLVRTVASTGTTLVVGSALHEKFGAEEVKNMMQDAALGLIVDVGTPFVTKTIDDLSPGSYSSFRHRVTQRNPNITQAQTRKLLVYGNRVANKIRHASPFILSILPSIEIR